MTSPCPMQQGSCSWVSGQTRCCAFAWQVLMEAITDAATPLNLAQHTYFNLNGEANGTILDHYLQLSSCALMCYNHPVGWRTP